jgi:hypothetical protein
MVLGSREAMRIVVFRSSFRGYSLVSILTTYRSQTKVLELISIVVLLRPDQIVLVHLPGHLPATRRIRHIHAPHP